MLHAGHTALIGEASSQACRSDSAPFPPLQSQLAEGESMSTIARVLRVRESIIMDSASVFSFLESRGSAARAEFARQRQGDSDGHHVGEASGEGGERSSKWASSEGKVVDAGRGFWLAVNAGC
jgi:hypothetical protein